MGRKKKNDYGCRINNNIFRRVTAFRENKKYGKLIKEEGFMVRLCGRDVGLCEVDGIWIAIDIKTGLRIDSHQSYKKRGNLINYLKKHAGYYQTGFTKYADVIEEAEGIFDRLKYIYEYGKRINKEVTDHGMQEEH